MDKNRTFLEEAINKVFVESPSMKTLAKEIAQDTIDFMKDKINEIVEKKQLAATILTQEVKKELKEYL